MSGGPARGVYVLWLEVSGEVQIGRLGRWHLDGGYAYVGSAQGPGGLRRLQRHREVAEGRNPTRRWHIDFLLAAGTWRGAFVMEAEDPRLECRLARALAQRLPPAIPRFGSSDCRCPTHLFAVPDVPGFHQLMLELGLHPV
ncbi:GIY-YIG nuclease family protein [Thermoflexus sp.]|uniref:GIY-YIG nuclease family protein n=1 Tax=Thermoflexus sp. TaxID=1969742 RepID=UPI00175DF406|nr:GIY-YIG nuclease family protein [Thermoflexus sp.]